MDDQHWHDISLRCFGMLLDGRAQTTGIRQRGKEATLLLLINGQQELVDFVMPECAAALHWSLLLDTNAPESGEKRTFKVGANYSLIDRSLALFVLEAETPAGASQHSI